MFKKIFCKLKDFDTSTWENQPRIIDVKVQSKNLLGFPKKKKKNRWASKYEVI